MLSDNTKAAAIAAASALAGAGLVLLATRVRAYRPPQVWKPKDMGGKFGKINQPTAGPREVKALPRGKHPFQLYSLATPNGVKVTIFLEELLDQYGDACEYDAYTVNIGACEQFTSGFVAANPNSKIPAMLHYTEGRKEPVRIFESGAIMLYLAEKLDKKNIFIPTDSAERAECLSWLMWQMGSAPFVGGGFGHFYNYAPVKIEYAVDRYTMETKRLLDVLERHLGGKDGHGGGPYIMGKNISIADFAIWPWMGGLVLGALYNAATFLSVEEYPNAIKWAKLIEGRPAVRRGKMVNRTWGDLAGQLRERHSRADFDSR